MIVLGKLALGTIVIAGTYFAVAYVYERLVTNELVRRQRELIDAKKGHIIIDMGPLQAV